MRNQPQDNYIRGVLMIIMSAFCFACMNVCIRFAGDLPSIQKSFFRNLVAAVFAGIIIIRNNRSTEPVSLRIPKEARAALILRCAFGTVGILCNFYAVLSTVWMGKGKACLLTKDQKLPPECSLSDSEKVCF